MRRLTPRQLLVLAAVTAVYFVAGKLGLRLAFLHPSASPVWPPTGIALAAFLLLGPRTWPAILLGAFLVNVTTAGTVATSIAIAGGNTLEGAVGAYLARRYAHGRQAFDRAPDVFRFIILAVMGSTLIAATVGVAALAAGGFVAWPVAREVWLTWWLGDAVGGLILAPLILLWARPSYPGMTPRSAIELGALLLSLGLVGVIVFGDPLFAVAGGLPLDFLCIPVLIWAAYRFGPREAMTAVFILSVIAIWGTLRSVGPFARYEPNESLLVLQAFLGASTAMTLILAALVAERRETLQQLEARVDDRTRDLRSAVAQLQDAQEALVRREKLATLGEIAGGVGHELRNPLGVLTNAIYYLTEVLKDSPANVRRHLDIVRDQIAVSERIVSNLLDYARDKTPQRAAVSLAQLASAQLARAGRLDGITVKLDLPADLPPALADPVQLGQIILNLLTNAIQAMDPKGGTLTVRARRHEDRLTFEVADTGRGIPHASLEKIFEPLFTTKARGMGLGLAVSRSLARANDAQLTVTSVEGEGTTFSLTLPAAS